MDPSSWAYYNRLQQQVQQPAAAELQQYATQLQVQQLRQVAEQQQQAQAQAQHHQVSSSVNINTSKFSIIHFLIWELTLDVLMVIHNLILHF